MILELENICKEYMQGKIPVPVLKNINFSMEEGEYVANNSEKQWLIEYLKTIA